MVRDHSVTWTVARVLRRGVAVGALVAGALVPGTAVLGAAPGSVDVAIVAGKSGNGFDFNGFSRGAMAITVPVGWQVVVHFTNVGTVGHSLAVLPSGAHNQPSPPSSPAFSGAITPNFAAGLAPKGAEQMITFTASKAGTYEFVCGVPGHAVVGQWDTLIVSATADTASVTPAGAASLTVK